MRKFSQIPFFSQKIAPAEARFFPSSQSVEYWEPRACGIACVRMILAAAGFQNMQAPENFWQLIDEGLRRNAYVPAGWVHQGLLQILQSRGLQGKCVRQKSYEELAISLHKKRLAILSVSVGLNGGKLDEMRQIIRPGGHLVVAEKISSEPLTGEQKIFIHHPSYDEQWNWSRYVERPEVEKSMSGSWIEIF